MNRLRSILRRLVSGLLGLIPSRVMEGLLLRLAHWYSQGKPPAEGLRFLLRLDNALYSLQGGLAVKYGGGLHTKHRHTGYHDFFVQRLSRGEQVLDIGCGAGALAADMARRAGAEVLGLDLEEANIAEARARRAHPRVEYMTGDALRDLPGRRFDVVVLSNVLEHLPERPEFLGRAVRRLRPKRILIRVPLFERDWRVPLKKELGLDWRADPTHHTEYTLESFAQEMEEAGLEVVYQQERWGKIWAEVKPNAA